MYCICLKERFLKNDYFRFVSWIIFPLAPDNSSSAISNFSKIEKIDNSNFTAGVNYVSGHKDNNIRLPTPSIAHFVKLSGYMCLNKIWKNIVFKHLSHLPFVTGVAPWAANIFANFRKLKWLYSIGVIKGAGKFIHEKNMASKTSWHRPFQRIWVFPATAGHTHQRRESRRYPSGNNPRLQEKEPHAMSSLPAGQAVTFYSKTWQSQMVGGAKCKYVSPDFISSK